MAELVDVSFFAFSYIFCKFRLNTKEGGAEIDLCLPHICQCGGKRKRRQKWRKKIKTEIKDKTSKEL